MFLIETEKDLLNAFRPRDRKQVELPPDFRFPHVLRDYTAWSDPQGVRTFLVLMEPLSKRPMGIAFERDHGGGSKGSMCDWCHAFGSSNEIGMLTAEVSSKRRVGVHVCLDLRCAEKIEQAANLAGRNARELTRQAVERMVRFAHEALGIKSVPAA
ncbi:MAG TPA: FBP domain-containing protein [Myxococcaceae bacterium]|nr:FBP domain-containing protein [Myxococcaceae bacterium]